MAIMNLTWVKLMLMKIFNCKIWYRLLYTLMRNYGYLNN